MGKSRLPSEHILEMAVKGKTYLQYCCPLHYGKKYKGLYFICPAAHPKYFCQKGCNYLIRLTQNVRDRIDYRGRKFKKKYNLRTSVERVFSRLLAITKQRPTVIGLQATKNHCTIVHITVMLVALMAHRLGYDDKIRFKYLQAVTGQEIVPGIIACIQTFGDRINLHPHSHCLVSEGGEQRDGRFHHVRDFDDGLIG